MNRLQDMQVEFKIAPEDSSSLIGSNAIFTTEDLYTIPLQTVYQRRSRHLKRTFDIVAALLLLLFIWLDIWFVNQKGGFLHNIFAVLKGEKSWVGLHTSAVSSENTGIAGVLYPADAYPKNVFSEEIVCRLEELYARNYKVGNDLTILMKGFGKLGR